MCFQTFHHDSAAPADVDFADVVSIVGDAVNDYEDDIYVDKEDFYVGGDIAKDDDQVFGVMLKMGMVTNISSNNMVSILMILFWCWVLRGG